MECVIEILDAFEGR